MSQDGSLCGDGGSAFAITLKDCTATVSEEEQRLAVEKNYPMFSRPMDHDEFLDALSGKQVAEVSGRGYSE